MQCAEDRAVSLARGEIKQHVLAGLKLAEWPEKAGDKLPVADLDITLTTTSDQLFTTSVALAAFENRVTGVVGATGFVIPAVDS